MFTLFKFDGQEYVSGDAIYQAKILPKCGKNARDMVKNNNIGLGNYIFARPKGTDLVKTEGKSYRHDKVYILANYLLENVSQYNDYIKRTLELVPVQAAEKKCTTATAAAAAAETSVVNKTTTNAYGRKIHTLPVLTLEDHEKFRSDDGTICEVRCLGERAHDKIYFNLRDVAAMLGKDPNSFRRDVVNNDDSRYLENEHFVLANEGPESGPLLSNDPEYYLTFKGLLKALHCSRTGNMNKYIDWVVKLVYTAQMGTLEQKHELINDLAGADFSTTELLLSGETPVPGIYLFNIDGKRYKFGRTNNILRRFQEHKRKYGDQLKLVTFVRIENYYIEDKDVHVLAENKLKELLQELRIKVDGHNELIECDDLNEVLPVYQAIRKEFGKTATEIVQDLRDKLKDAECIMRIKDKDIELINERFNCELQLKDSELKLKDSELKLKDSEWESKLKDKEIEILTLKLQLMEKI